MPYNLFYRDKPVEELYALSLETIRNERRIDYRLRHEVIGIDPVRQEVSAIDLDSRREYREGYDFLVYATGTRAVRLDLPGFADPEVFPFRDLDDARHVKSFIYDRKPHSALLVGAGYTSLEVADVLCNLQIKPVIVEKGQKILPAFCDDLREKVQEKLKEKGVPCYTGVDVKGKEGPVVQTSVGNFPADMVVSAVGIHPCTELLAAAGGELGVAGAAKVNRNLLTTLPRVFAAGDCAEHYVRQLGRNGYMALGPVANKQGRLVGHNIVNHQQMREFHGIDQTAVFKFFDLTVGTTGLIERQFEEVGKDVVKVVVDAPTRGSFPGGGMMRVILFCERGSGLLLGAQMVGQDVVAKRLDVVATAIYAGLTVFQMSELDLSYAPPYAPVWDPLLVAANQAVRLV